jgi:hypothetical protein
VRELFREAHSAYPTSVAPCGVARSRELASVCGSGGDALERVAVHLINRWRVS